MKSADIAIIGGGMVGLALAGLLAKADCKIAIVEKSEPLFDPNITANRVSAINFASESMLKQIGAWQQIPQDKLSPYDKMHVWEKDSFATIDFDNNDASIKSLGLEQLGFIIENQHIQHVLWKQVSEQSNVEMILATPQSLGVSETSAVITLDNGELLSTKLVVGADGANSWVRNQADIPLTSRDYQHSALVCNVKTAESHQQTANQIFAPDSILAFLPFKNEFESSIVWSLPPEKAEQLANCDEKAFNQALTIAFDNYLGLCELQSSRGIYPLTARYARDFAQPRVALMGDAAHTIHPLAGLGVNLGFMDAVELSEQLQNHLQQGNDIGEYRHLREYERKRKAEAMKLLTTMGVLKETFAGNNPVKKLVRGLGVSFVNQLPILKNSLIKQAVGLQSTSIL